MVDSGKTTETHTGQRRSRAGDWVPIVTLIVFLLLGVVLQFYPLGTPPLSTSYGAAVKSALTSWAILVGLSLNIKVLHACCTPFPQANLCYNPDR